MYYISAIEMLFSLSLNVLLKSELKNQFKIFQCPVISVYKEGNMMNQTSKIFGRFKPVEVPLPLLRGDGKRKDGHQKTKTQLQTLELQAQTLNYWEFF